MYTRKEKIFCLAFWKVCAVIDILLTPLSLLAGVALNAWLMIRYHLSFRQAIRVLVFAMDIAYKRIMTCLLALNYDKCNRRLDEFEVEIKNFTNELCEES